MSGVEMVYELVRTLALFGAVAALAYGASRYAGDRWRRRAAGRRLAVLEALPLGSRQHLCLVRVGDGEVLCLAVAEREVTPLARYRGEAARRLLAADGEAGSDA